MANRNSLSGGRCWRSASCFVDVVVVCMLPVLGDENGRRIGESCECCRSLGRWLSLPGRESKEHVAKFCELVIVDGIDVAISSVSLREDTAAVT